MVDGLMCINDIAAKILQVNNNFYVNKIAAT